MCTGIVGDQAIGSYFISDNLNGEAYLELLQVAIDPTMTNAIENINNNYHQRMEHLS